MLLFTQLLIILLSKLIGANLKLSEEQKAEVEMKLEQAGIRYSCPMCGKDSLQLLDALYELKQYSKSNGMVSSKHVLINLLCSHCKFLAPFSASEMGITESTSE